MATDHRLAYVPALDGIRAVAVVAVVLFHAEFGAAPGGFLGVSVFFTLSGFLITSLLLTEYAADGRISLTTFFRRRVRRLLPAAWVCVALVLLATPWWTSGQRDLLTGDALAALGHVANWRAAFSTSSYRELFATSPSPLAHFWSLAIEEQFYVVLPIVAAVALRWGRRTFGIVVGVLLVASVAAGLATSSFDLAYNGTHVRAAELLVGIALAVAFDRWRRSGRVAPVKLGQLSAMIGTGGLLVLVATVDLNSPGLLNGGFVGVALLSAGLIAGAHSPGPVTRGLSARPLVAIGKVSYGIYLFHWPIFVLMTPERLGVDGVVLAVFRLGAVAAVTTISSLAIERPIRSGRALGAATGMTYVASTAAIVLVIGALAVPVTPRTATDELLTVGNAGVVRFDPSTPNTGSVPAPVAAAIEPVARSSTTVAAEPEPFRVLVVGSDQQALSAMHRLGRRNGLLLDVVSAVQPGCPVAGGQQVALGNGTIIDIGNCEPSYDRISRALTSNFEAPPDLVVVSTGPIDDGLIRRATDAGSDELSLAEIGARRGAADLQVQAITQLLSEQGAPVVLAWWGDDGPFLQGLQRLAFSRPRVVGVSSGEDELAALVTDQLDVLAEPDDAPESINAEPVRTLVIGDSTSLIFARALHDADPRVDVLWAGDNGCPVVRADLMYPRVNQPGTTLQCEDYATKLPPLLDEFDPEVVVIVAGPTELAAMSFGDDGTVRLPGDDAWIAHHDTEMDRLLGVIDGGGDRSLGVQVLIADSPPIGRGAFSTREMTSTSRLTGWNEQVVRWSTTYDGVQVLPYADAVIAFESERGSIRPDRVHPDVALLTELARIAFVDPIVDAGA